MNTEIIEGKLEEHKISLLRASGSGENYPPRLTIEIHEQIEETITPLTELRQLFTKQAEVLADALVFSLPGGTVDALLAELMRRRASLFVMPFKVVTFNEAEQLFKMPV